MQIIIALNEYSFATPARARQSITYHMQYFVILALFMPKTQRAVVHSGLLCIKYGTCIHKL